MATKYIFVTGGVASSLGKGITAASLGRLLKARGYSVTIQKFDPYLNVDPGTMNPYQHGEVFVTEDGMETDLDLGHYERFIDENLTKWSSVTSGQVYFSVLNRERNGGYNGGTVQIIPHVTNEIKEKLYRVGERTDVVITEIGGTIGDIAGQAFIEAIRQFQWESMGIPPNMLVCRSDDPVPYDMRQKLAQFCNVPAKYIIQNLDAQSLYEVPLMLEKEGFGDKVCEALKMEKREPDLKDWIEVVERFQNPQKSVTIALVGKYIQLNDAYLSVVAALQHGGIAHCVHVVIKWIQADDLTGGDVNLDEVFKDVQGILVPGGFGNRGIEGKMLAAQYAREHNVPYLGICLGMQIAVIEFARHVVGLEGADSTEFNPDAPYPVIELMPKQLVILQSRGTLRLGDFGCLLVEGSRARALYGADMIVERHRHRFEFNNDYREQLEEAGLTVAGVNPDRNLVEVVELKDHPWYVGCQYHPEFKSRPNRPHPLFVGFVGAAIERMEGSSK